MLARFLHGDSDGNFGREDVGRFVSRRLLGHGVGAIPAPGSSLFCFGSAALWVTASRQILSAKHSVNAALRHSGADAESPANTLIVSPDNASRRELNAAVRQELRANEMLAPEDLSMRVLV
jgi:hypothetical protein